MLDDYPKEIILKDGTGVTLRPLKEGDEPLLSEMYKHFSENDRWFMNHDVSDPEMVSKWTCQRDLKRAISIAAVLSGQIIANATLIMKYYGSRSRIGELRVSVDPPYRGKNLGTWMLLDLINLAMAAGLEILVMPLVEGRDASLLRSVRKLDFSQEALFQDYLKDRDGRLCNLVIMVKRLRQGLLV